MFLEVKDICKSCGAGSQKRIRLPEVRDIQLQERDKRTKRQASFKDRLSFRRRSPTGHQAAALNEAGRRSLQVLYRRCPGGRQRGIHPGDRRDQIAEHIRAKNAQ